MNFPDLKLLDKIRIMLEDTNKEKGDWVSSKQIAEVLNISAGSSNANVRQLVTATIDYYGLPVMSSGKGYCLMKKPDDLIEYADFIYNKNQGNIKRLTRITQYFVHSLDVKTYKYDLITLLKSNILNMTKNLQELEKQMLLGEFE